MVKKGFMTLNAGKDLMRDPNCPAFVKDEVAALESKWNDCCRKTMNRLSDLNENGRYRAIHLHLQCLSVVMKMPAKATISLLALTSLGDATQMGMFLLVLHQPRNLQKVQPLPLFWEFVQQTLPLQTSLSLNH